MEELKKYLEEIKTEAKAELDEIPEEFNDDNDKENYYFYNGFLSALNSITEYINTGRKRIAHRRRGSAGFPQHFPQQPRKGD